jgi:hypothetical protein
VYFNLMPLYGSRQPGEDGFYSFQMVADSGLLTLKTQDKAISDQIDNFHSRGMGLQLNGDVIERVFDVSCATGGNVLATERHVFDYNAALITSSNPYGGGLKPILLHPECKFIDATNSPSTGDQITLRKGDRFYAFGNANGQATYVFVTRRSS